MNCELRGSACYGALDFEMVVSHKNMETGRELWGPGFLR